MKKAKSSKSKKTVKPKPKAKKPKISKSKKKFKMINLFSEEKTKGAEIKALPGEGPHGTAGYHYEIVKTPTKIVKKLLSEKYSKKVVDKKVSSKNFFTIFLEMSISPNDPDNWKLTWGRFFLYLDYGVDVLSYSPKTGGLEVEVEKTGSRKISFGLDGSIKSPKVIPADAEFKGGVKYEKGKGWTVKFKKQVHDLKGSLVTQKDETKRLKWEFYENKAAEVPESNIGETARAFSSFVVSTPKDEDENIIEVKVKGEVVGGLIRRSRPLKSISPDKFEIKPT